ncbi:hypothetical protein [Streptomyces aurantiogriseus]|uniref:DUF2637 domain-containing protein n=1 Tax=Streptomyces aurantiogriseus TaxID=66870 RepID=A0A918CHF3_9ACTN|nr:hypothetical protein [Streptomyces aurantiogriseus]GGR24054.1 hypothetical protein GCM10010251_45160 [Streptomyces aurantiogriseus]
MRPRKSPAPTKDAGPSPSSAPVGWTDRALLTLALVAGIAVTAAGEWELARQVGIAPVVAPLLAVVIDVYVIAAVRAGQGRDVVAALAMMGGAQVAAHLLSTRHIGSSVALVAAVSLVAPVVIWRVHALAGAGKSVVIQRTPEPTVNVSRASTPPWKPAMTKWPPAFQPPAVGPVKAALTSRPKVVTAHVSPEPEEAAKSPQKPQAEEVVRRLYDELGGKRPGTGHIRDALKAAGLPCSDGTCRETRKRVEAKEPELKALPPA